MGIVKNDFFPCRTQNSFSSENESSPFHHDLSYAPLSFTYFILIPTIIYILYPNSPNSHQSYTNSMPSNEFVTFFFLILRPGITQSVHIRPWKTISQHNIASGRNVKKTKYYIWTKYFDWKRTLLGSNISSGHNLQIAP